MTDHYTTACEAYDRIMSSPIYGIAMETRLDFSAHPISKLLHLHLEERENAKAFALQYMREIFVPCVIFVRQDGQHEVWHRGELEEWAKPNPSGEVK